MMKVAVLGGGRVGALIAHDLNEWGGYDVTVYDADPEIVKGLRETLSLNGQQCNLVLPSSYGVTRDYHIVVNALPGHMGFRVLKRLIGQSIPLIVDISFMPENPRMLDSLAREHKSTVIVDAGLAPGLNNLILGSEINTMDRVDSYVCMVGGLPRASVGLWHYKASFSPIDVIEEYTRPTKIVRDGEIITVDPLSDCAPFVCRAHGIGWEQHHVSFNTDGLRTLLDLADVPNMTEKTIRLRKHYDLIQVMRETGLFDPDIRSAVEAKMFPHWEYGPNDKDYTIMQVRVEGMVNREPSFATHTLYDKHDGKFSSMARTTGYTAAAFVRLGAGNIAAGINTPEELAKHFGPQIVTQLSQRGVHIDVTRGRM